jgi:hypothetical protein
VTEHPARYCNGGPHALEGCGELARVVCTERVEPGERPLQWYACDAPEHQAGALTEPIGDWFARVQSAEPAEREDLERARIRRDMRGPR